MAEPADREPKARIFISYSRKDMAFADRLEAALKEQKFEPLIDHTEIYAFDDWWKRIQPLIAQADNVIFVLSPDAVASQVCAREVAFTATLNKRFSDSGRTARDPIDSECLQWVHISDVAVSH